jgi:hypothetical protein
MTVSVRNLGCPVFSFSSAPYEGDAMHGRALVFEALLELWGAGCRIAQH